MSMENKALATHTSPEGETGVAPDPAPAQPAWARILSQTTRAIGRHILLVVLLGLLITILVTLASVPGILNAPYQAEAVAVLRPRDPETEAGAPPPNAFDSPTATSRTNTSPQTPSALRVLMNSVDIAEKVKVLAAAHGDPEIRELATFDVADIAGSVEVDTRLNLLFIRASTPSPVVATWLANTWSELGVEKINEIFSPVSPVAQAALDQARADLDKAQGELRDFIANDPRPRLNQELADTQAFITAVGASNIANQLALYDNERAIIREKMMAYIGAVHTLDQQLGDLRAFRTRIEQGPEDPGTLYNNQLTLFLLQNKIASLPIEELRLDYRAPEVEAVTGSRANQLSDVDALIGSAQALQDNARAKASELETRLNEPFPALATGSIGAAPDVVREYIERQNTLKAQIEEHDFQAGQLLKTRDWHQGTFDSLRTRVAEQQIEAVLAGVVNVGSPALLSETVRSRSPFIQIVKTAAIGLVLSLLAGMVLAYALSIFQPRLNSNKMLLRRFGLGRMKPAHAGYGGSGNKAD